VLLDRSTSSTATTSGFPIEISEIRPGPPDVLTTEVVRRAQDIRPKTAGQKSYASPCRHTPSPSRRSCGNREKQ